MTVLYSAETTGVFDGTVPPKQQDGSVCHASLYRMRATIALASQATTDQILLGKLPPGAVFAYGILNGDTSLGSSTLAIGNSSTHASNDKYRAAAVHTATVPTLFGKASAADDAPLAAETEVWATWASAALPSSGILVIEIFYSRR